MQVRQTQKVRGRRAAGAARLASLYEKAVHGVHNLSEGVAAVGSAARMASDSWAPASESSSSSAHNAYPQAKGAPRALQSTLSGALPRAAPATAALSRHT